MSTGLKFDIPQSLSCNNWKNSLTIQGFSLFAAFRLPDHLVNFCTTLETCFARFPACECCAFSQCTVPLASRFCQFRLGNTRDSRSCVRFGQSCLSGNSELQLLCATACRK